MVFAVLVCALLLYTVLYFLVLITGEIAFWLHSRIMEAFRARSQSLAIPSR